MAAISAINLGTNKTAVAISAGGSHTCAVLNDATVKCWGLNIFGQLGQDNTANLGFASGQMSSLASINVGTNKNILSIQTSEYHSCALLNLGTVKCWGLNSSGQLGQDSATNLGDASGETVLIAAISLAPPGAPRAVSTSSAYRSIIVSWLAPLDIGQSAITLYTVTASANGGTCSTTLVTCTVSGLTSSIAYSFTVKATNSAGAGPNSNATGAVKALATGTAPGKPTAVTGTVGNKKVTVSWTAPLLSGSSSIVGYTATSSPGSKTCTVANTTTCAIGGLTNGTSYTFTVYAFSSAGTGLSSVSSGAVTPMWSSCHSGKPEGYWLAEQDGQVYSFGQASSLGSPTLTSGRIAADIEATSTGCGYWVIDSAGVFHRFGDAAQIPQANLTSLVSWYDFSVAPDSSEIVVSAIPTALGTGAYLFTSIGRVIRTGTTTAITDSAGRENLLWITQLNSPIVDARLSSTGNGYWMLAADGGIFTFGDAKFSGSVPQRPVSDWANEEIVSFAPDPDGVGYVVAAKSGKAWWFDHASRKQLPDVLQEAFGSRLLNKPIAAVMSRSCGGYLMVGSDGGVFATPFSDCGFQGSLGGSPPDTPIIALTPIG